MENINPIDVSQRLFSEALKTALDKYGGKILALSKRLNINSRAKLYAWSKGHMPPYSTMQKEYVKLMEIINEK